MLTLSSLPLSHILSHTLPSPPLSHILTLSLIHKKLFKYFYWKEISKFNSFYCELFDQLRYSEQRLLWAKATQLRYSEERLLWAKATLSKGRKVERQSKRASRILIKFDTNYKSMREGGGEGKINWLHTWIFINFHYFFIFLHIFVLTIYSLYFSPLY